MKHRELTEKIIGCAYRVLMAVCLCIALFAGGGSVRGQGPEVGGQRPEVGSQNLPAVSLAGSEVRDQGSEGRSRNSEVSLRPIGAYPPACKPYGLEAAPVGSQEYCEESSQETVSTEEIFEYFDDFIVYLRGVRKKDRILVCDVVIELNRGMKLPQERIELRKIIYNTLKEPLKIPPPASQARALRARGDFQPLDLHEIRRVLKEEIKSSLNNLLDDEIIKNIYFTKFVLL